MRPIHLLLAGLLTASCAGSSTGNPAIHPTPGSPCGEQTMSLASVDTPSPLNFTANDMLDLARGAHDVDLLWTDAVDPHFLPTGGESVLHIEVSAPSPHPRFTGPSSGGLVNGGISSVPFMCQSQVEADVTVRLRSQDGALDESFAATLLASDSESASLGTIIDPKNVHGSVRLDPSSTGYTFAGIRVSITFTEGATSGDVVGIADGSSSTVEKPLGRWME